MLKWCLIFAGWTLVAFFYTSQALIENGYRARPLVWWRVLVWELFFCYLWLALTPVVLRLNRRFPFERGRIIRNLPLHIVAGVVLSLLHLLIYSALYAILPSYSVPADERLNTFFFERYKIFVAAYLHFCLISYWGALTVHYLAKYYSAYQERALRASQLESSLAQSQLEVLKLQLQPHFLFNTLNTISELVHEDVDAADRMIARLSSLLRTSLDTVGVQEVPLKEEIDFLRKYLDIQQVRFGERLKVQIAAAPETLNDFVPYMILQPLVENAVRYAVAPRAGGGRISIEAKRIDKILRLTVYDDGQNPNNGGGGGSASAKTGISERVGLSNTRARLRHLYGDRQKFYYEISSGGEMTVVLEIPLKNANQEQR